MIILDCPKNRNQTVNKIHQFPIQNNLNPLKSDSHFGYNARFISDFREMMFKHKFMERLSHKKGEVSAYYAKINEISTHVKPTQVTIQEQNSTIQEENDIQFEFFEEYVWDQIFDDKIFEHDVSREHLIPKVQIIKLIHDHINETGLDNASNRIETVQQIHQFPIQSNNNPTKYDSNFGYNSRFVSDFTKMMDKHKFSVKRSTTNALSQYNGYFVKINVEYID